MGGIVSVVGCGCGCVGTWDVGVLGRGMWVCWDVGVGVLGRGVSVLGRGTSVLGCGCGDEGCECRYEEAVKTSINPLVEHVSCKGSQTC